jgi:hypothetical protein
MIVRDGADTTGLDVTLEIGKGERDTLRGGGAGRLLDGVSMLS